MPLFRAATWLRSNGRRAPETARILAAETEPHRSAAYPWLRSNDKGQPCPERSSSATAGLVRMQLLARAAAGGHCRLNHGLFGKYSYPFPNGPSRYDSGHVRAWPCFESSCPLVGPGLRGGWDSAQCEGHDRRPERRTGQRGQRAVRVPVKRPDRIGPASAPDRLRLRKRIAPRSVRLARTAVRECRGETTFICWPSSGEAGSGRRHNAAAMGHSPCIGGRRERGLTFVRAAASRRKRCRCRRRSAAAAMC